MSIDVTLGAGLDAERFGKDGQTAESAAEGGGMDAARILRRAHNCRHCERCPPYPQPRWRRERCQMTVTFAPMLARE